MTYPDIQQFNNNHTLKFLSQPLLFLFLVLTSLSPLEVTFCHLPSFLWHFQTLNITLHEPFSTFSTMGSIFLLPQFKFILIYEPFLFSSRLSQQLSFLCYQQYLVLIYILHRFSNCSLIICLDHVLSSHICSCYGPMTMSNMYFILNKSSVYPCVSVFISASFDFFITVSFSVSVSVFIPLSLPFPFLLNHLNASGQGSIFRSLQRYVDIKWILSLSLLELWLTAFSRGFCFLCGRGPDFKVRPRSKKKWFHLVLTFVIILLRLKDL